MDGDQPVGGQWNFDADNRWPSARPGPGLLPPPRTRFAPMPSPGGPRPGRARFADHPGSLAASTGRSPPPALQALDDFIAHRLPQFGTYQDAMWTGEPWLYHARMSRAMNLKLLHAARGGRRRRGRLPRRSRAPLAAVEGFVRQILGWREYVRGVYWTQMPSYLRAQRAGRTAAAAGGPTGPATPSWPACATRSGRRWRMATPTTSSG
jgi:deoxyribodipyrimidine photolyase-related protein